MTSMSTSIRVRVDALCLFEQDSEKKQAASAFSKQIHSIKLKVMHIWMPFDGNLSAESVFSSEWRDAIHIYKSKSNFIQNIQPQKQNYD